MNWRRIARRTTLVALDALLVAFAFLMAYEFRLDFGQHPDARYLLPQCFHLIAWVVAVHLLFFYVFDLYRGVTRYAGLRELIAIAAAATVSAAALCVYNLIREHGLHQTPRIPWSIPPLTWLLVITSAGGIRYARRMVAEGRLLRRSPAEGRRALIVGATERGELVARELMRRGGGWRRPVGFIDDNPELRGRSIHGLPIFGGLDAIDRALEETGAEEVIVALDSPSPRQMKEIADRCGPQWRAPSSHRPVSIQRLPSAAEVLDGRVAVMRMRPVRIEDLLGREPVRLSLDEEENYLRGEQVLVTGAGGSIGGELCRQILPCRPQRLFLLGRGENSLYEIAAELGYRFPDERMELILADIQDDRKMAQVFERWRPTVVFHAAAHKHVPFGEIAPVEMARNNVFGTLNVARRAMAVGVKRFILISTDKAVRPTNVLGASKRVAELVAAALNEDGPTQFLSVRFGNVLGSRGSVVPLFLKQIEAGGPVTVTDPEMTRYFMTIPEAASLVLHAGAIGRGGQLLVLDMGDPVRIADLARTMITLAGYEPETDIEIRYVGARPGEKIHEELLTAQEGLEKTRHGKILVTQSERPDRAWLERELATLREQVEAGDGEGVRATLARLVPDFRPRST
ncbi:MAG: nucleoside-diphosphate sugar epimerase/dehydratase [Candidatus Sumerlaeota bacterium]|nr:nucleoside-diphosphate sugar epimerase/dehydratase [Candidatus Sumerlaeota bacterium]